MPGFAPVPGLAFLGRIRITLHLSPTCLPLVLHLSHSWCSGPHDSTLVSDLCPIRCCELLDATLVSHCLPVPTCLQPVCNLALDGKILCFHFPPTFFVSQLSLCCLLLVSLGSSWNGRISLGYHLSPIFPTSFPLLSPACFRIAFVLDLFFPPTVPWRATVQRWYIFFGGNFFFKLADDTDPPRLVGSIQWTFMSVTEEKVAGCL